MLAAVAGFFALRTDDPGVAGVVAVLASLMVSYTGRAPRRSASNARSASRRVRSEW